MGLIKFQVSGFRVALLLTHGDHLRIVSSEEIEAIESGTQIGSILSGYRLDMLNHPSFGRYFKNYATLTEYPKIAIQLRLSMDDLFWNRYYWLSRLAREWQSSFGYDAGLEQQVSQLIDSGEHMNISLNMLVEIDACIERDIV